MSAGAGSWAVATSRVAATARRRDLNGIDRVWRGSRAGGRCPTRAPART